MNNIVNELRIKFSDNATINICGKTRIEIDIQSKSNLKKTEIYSMMSNYINTNCSIPNSWMIAVTRVVIFGVK